MTGGQSGRLPPPGEKSVAFNISFTQELKAFLEKLLPIFYGTCGAPLDGGRKRAHKNLCRRRLRRRPGTQYRAEGKKAAGQAKALLYSALFAAANAIAMAAGGERWLGTVQQHILGNWYQRTIFFKWDLMFVGAGALVGMKTSLSLFIGGTVCWALYVP